MDFAMQVSELVANRERILRYAFLLQFVAAIPFLWLANATGRVHALLLLHGRTATGAVVAVVPVLLSSGSSSTAYEPVVVFRAGDPSRGEQFRLQEWKATKIAPSVGTSVSVLYDPADPDSAMVDRGYLNFFPWAPCAFIGLLLFFVAIKGFLALLFRRRAGG